MAAALSCMCTNLSQDYQCKVIFARHSLNIDVKYFLPYHICHCLKLICHSVIMELVPVSQWYLQFIGQCPGDKLWPIYSTLQEDKDRLNVSLALVLVRTEYMFYDMFVVNLQQLSTGGLF